MRYFMHDKNTELALLRYLNGSAKENDLVLLNDWVANPNNNAIFKKYLKAHFAIYLGMNDQDFRQMESNLIQKIRDDKSKLKRKKRIVFLKYAAVFVLLVSGLYYFQTEILQMHHVENVVVGDDKIILESSDGNIDILDNNTQFAIKDNKGLVIGKQLGDKIVYTKNKSITEMSYNTLKIPYGKQLEVVLSDGSEVMLNSGSTFKFPQNFIEGKKREVFLEGEAFFEVTKDSLHPFIVNANDLNIKVLGTEFNVSNYNEDIDTEVVLVGGAVTLKSNDLESEEVHLSPGQKGIFLKEGNKINTEEVNVSLYTGWLDGIVVFRETTFENITKKLERHFNIKIINTNSELAEEKFNATMDLRNEDINQILEYFKKIYDIDYQVKNNEVIIK
ncbi:FecR family protein [Zunongwangia atlantica]|uniref:Anti-sigma factor n=1 Tax=Zunongwangia atlantica 22II14-10F7 TaxID=1185767 RepID=A0A1Y1T6H4_9FLAO|nr:FecR domain-containing protein [Zunongwangia atlantica]ORL46165.1 anti-sigma factor [Zunongwangia atlantica 22II14-10F7]